MFSIQEVPLHLFPQDEREAVQVVDDALRSTFKYLNSFAGALALYDFCEAQDTTQRILVGQGSSGWTGEWRSIAGRDGAMSVHHFKHSMDGLSHAIIRSPFLAAHADRQLLSHGHAAFAAHFPQFTPVRNVVAHAAEFTKTPEVKATHAIDGSQDFGAVKGEAMVGLYLNVMLGRRYTVTFNGKVCQYELDQQSAEALNRSLSLMSAALTPAFELLRQRRAWSALIQPPGSG